MKAIIKKIHSPDVYDLKKYQPQDPEVFCFLLQLMIGPEGEIGEESFDCTVCTPKWLLNNCKKEDVILGRHYIIVFKYDYEILIDRLTKYVESCSGKTWKEIAWKLDRLGKWEFEDYKFTT